MTDNGHREIFVNLPVRDLEVAKRFFSNLGFTFDPKYTDENAACMVISDRAFVMLLVEPFFSGFTSKRICETATHNEALLALSCPSREAVDEMVERALAGGGSHAMDPLDHGFMYGWSFYDPDGHHWEVLWMDPAAAAAELPKDDGGAR